MTRTRQLLVIAFRSFASGFAALAAALENKQPFEITDVSNKDAS